MRLGKWRLFYAGQSEEDTGLLSHGFGFHVAATQQAR